MANELKIGPNANTFKPITQVLYDSVGSTAYVAAAATTVKLFAMGTAQAGVALLSIVTATVKKA